MSVTLEKGQHIDITKTSPGLHKITVALGWDAAKVTGGFLSKFIDLTPKIDCDTTVVMLDKNETFSDVGRLVYYGNQKDPYGSIVHNGDCLSGNASNADDEEIILNLDKIPDDVCELLFVANIYESDIRMQDFGMIKNAYIRVYETSTGTELTRFNLNENFAGKTTLLAAKVLRSNNEWRFLALGEGTTDPTLKDFVRNYYSINN